MSTKKAIKQDDEIIAELINNDFKLWGFQADFVHDENEAELNNILKLAIRRGEDAEIGRRFKVIVDSAMVSYLSMKRES